MGSVTLFDAQVFQTTAWNRGMGKYCIELIGEFLRQKNDGIVVLILNKNLSDTKRIKEIKDVFIGAEIVELDLPFHTEVIKGRQAAQKTLDTYIKATYGSGFEVSFCILSLFTFDYVAAFPSKTLNFIISYDLTPLLQWDVFKAMFAERVYFEHFKTLYEADHVLCISEAVRDQMMLYLGLDSDRVTSLNGAFIDRIVDHSIKSPIPEKRYILCPTADFPHKNNKRMVRAFAAYNERFGNQFTLVLTSNFSEASMRELRQYSDQLQFVGAVDDKLFEQYMRHAEIILFTSELEGLGLPVLEAVNYDIPVVCSDIPVLKEISSEAFYFANPVDETAIEQQLHAATIKEGWGVKHNEYARIAQKYTWERSCELLLGAMAKTTHRNLQKRNTVAKTAVVVGIPRSSRECIVICAALLQAAQKHDIDVFYSNELQQRDAPFYFSYLHSALKYSDFIPRRYERSLYISFGTVEDAKMLAVCALFPGTLLLIGTASSNAGLEKMLKPLYENASTQEVDSSIARCVVKMVKTKEVSDSALVGRILAIIEECAEGI